jgi:hypothetical protein
MWPLCPCNPLIFHKMRGEIGGLDYCQKMPWRALLEGASLLGGPGVAVTH